MIRSVMNVKGGIGKTSTAIQLAAGFAKAGRKTLIVDADGQATTSMLLLPDEDFNQDDHKNTISPMLSGKVKPEECIYQTSVKDLDLIPSNLALFNTIYDLQSSAINGLPQFRLRNLLKSLAYDEIIIDNNPSINMMSVNSIYAADQLIIPTSLDVGGLAGVKMTLSHAMSVIEELNYQATMDYRIVFTMVNRNNMEKSIGNMIRESYGDHVMQNVIRYQAFPFRKAHFENRILIDDKTSNVAEDYRKLIQEMIENG